MKGIGKFVIVSLVLVGMAMVTVPSTMAQEPEWFKYRLGSDRCIRARIVFFEYTENDQTPPANVRKVWEKCKEYEKKDVVGQKNREWREKNRAYLLN